jgi:hypothetical protein
MYVGAERVSKRIFSIQPEICIAAFGLMVPDVIVMASHEDNIFKFHFISQYIYLTNIFSSIW